MIPHLNLKNTLKFKSDDSRTEEEMKCYFSSLIRKPVSFIY